MKTALKMLSAAAFAVIVATPALACNGRGNCENAPAKTSLVVCTERLDRSPARLAFRFSPSVMVSIGWYGVVA